MSKKLFPILLIVSAFIVGSWASTAKVNAKSAVKPATVQRENDCFAIECGHTVWYFYCAGQPGCNCIRVEGGAGTGCGDNATGDCCKTCFR